MSTILKQQFVRLETRIDNLHADIERQLRERMEAAGIKQPALADFFCFPEAKGFPYHTAHTVSKTKQWFALPSFKAWYTIGVYNKPQCGIMPWAAKTFRALEVMYGSSVLNKVPTPHELQEMSMFATKPSIALMFKYAWIYYGYEECGWFMGNHACTKPVRDYVKMCHGGTQVGRINMLTAAIAEEIDMDPLRVNSAMWLMWNG